MAPTPDPVAPPELSPDVDAARDDHGNPVLGWLAARRLRALPSAWVLTLGLLVSGFVVDAGAPAPAAPAMGSSPAAMAGMVTGSGTPVSVVRWVIPVTLLVAALFLLLPWERLRPRAQAVSAVVGVAMVVPLQLGLLPWSPHHAVVVLLPVLFLALRSGSRALAVALVISTAAFWIPVFMGMHDFMDIVGHGVIYSSVVIGVGATVHSLISRLHAQQEYITRMARLDLLTGAWNRRGWTEELTRAFHRAGRASQSLTVILADFDHFKTFNDRHGHQVGDALLKKTVAAWTAELRDVDFLARWGGDEFAFILPDCPYEQCRWVIERLSSVVPYAQHASFGFATWNGAEEPDDVVRRADAALYAVKERRAPRKASPRPEIAALRAAQAMRSQPAG